MTMRLSQLLFFQVQRCCPPPPTPPPPVLLSLSLPMLLLSSSLSSCQGVQSGISLEDRSSHSNAPASRSLRRARDNGRVTGGGEILSFCECRRETERGQGAVKGRGCESESLGLWTAGRIEVPRWAFMPGLMGPDSAEYIEGQQGSTLTFLFTQSIALCVRPVIDWRPVQGGSLPFAQCMLAKTLKNSRECMNG